MTIFELDLDNADQVAEFAERTNAALYPDYARWDIDARITEDCNLALALTTAMREWAPADSTTNH